METKIADFISSIRLGEVKEYKNISVIPVFLKDAVGPEYISMDEAISSGVLKIKETSTGGNVPELIAENNGQKLILLLDGEEVTGAKQNRVLNATILLNFMSKTIIPVSCVEAHRWSYVSEEFAASKNLLNYSTRLAKEKSVSQSLKNSNRFMSDQGEIWDKINEMSDEMKVTSHTRAMSDVYKTFDEDLEEYIINLPSTADQSGIFVFIDGKIAGLDIFSQTDTYSKLHSKLIKSYCMDALRKELARKNINLEKSTNSKREQAEFPKASLERAKYFLEETKLCNESCFKSAGLGDDYRYEGQFIIGSALLYNDTVIHMAFFKNEDSLAAAKSQSGNIQSYRDRMRNRSI